MKKFGATFRHGSNLIVPVGAIALLLGCLLLYRLGSLLGGISHQEAITAITPVGWHGIYYQPLDLPIKLIQSVDFKLFPAHGASLTRFPNVLIGALTIVEFIVLIKLWHGQRMAFLAGVLFATNAWVLHVSRLASYDVLYLWIVPTLLLINFAISKYGNNLTVWYLSLMATLFMLYIPGAIWLILAFGLLSREPIFKSWRDLNTVWNKFISSGLALVAALPLLLDLIRSGQLKLWIGIPARWASPALMLKHFVAVPVHLLVRGPEYPNLWLGKAPVLDVFALAASLVGMYFYVTHWSSGRSKLLASLLVIGWLLAALGGPVGLSVLVPLMYAFVATGITYLLREWLKFFPRNPLARAGGVFLISLLVALAAFYNLRAYYVAWPHNPTTRATFHIYR